MLKIFKDFLAEHIAELGGGDLMVDLAMFAVTALLAVITYYIAKSILLALEHIVMRSSSKWDDELLDNRMLRGIAQLAPALVVNWALPAFFTGASGIPRWTQTLTSLYILWAIVRIVVIFLNNLFRAMSLHESTQAYAIKGVFQMFKLIAIGIGILIGLSILFGKEPTAILATLGASAAVLSFVFKDTILGLVASVQLTANKMLKKGDWIESEKHNINGTVTDISLTTVKICNWDNTISTIPPYTLITDSFQNYEAMFESGGRRVCRSILIDVNTIRFCTREELKELIEKGRLDGLDIDSESDVINLQLLRSYIEHYLKTDARVNHSMLAMVRQLEPTPNGLPLQLYFFTAVTTWVDYEKIQSDIFDHIYAIVNEFGLSMFQTITSVNSGK